MADIFDAADVPVVDQEVDGKAVHAWTLERAEKSLARMIEWIGRHDSRSAGLMGITVAMMGAMSAATPSFAQWTLTFCVVLSVTAGGFGIVLFQLMRGQMPRMRRGGKPSLTFFGTVAGMQPDEYRRQFMQMSEADYLEDVLSQCYINARILRSKFRCLKRALMALLLTAVPWACALSLAKSL